MSPEDYMREEAHRRSRQARMDAAASVLESLAQSQSVTALLHPDPKRAAEAFAQSMCGIVQASMLRAGLLEIEAVKIPEGGSDGG